MNKVNKKAFSTQLQGTPAFIIGFFFNLTSLDEDPP